MDVARQALGRTGGRIIGLFLFVLQTGVSVVFYGNSFARGGRRLAMATTTTIMG
jgi:hypothetical protein